VEPSGKTHGVALTTIYGERKPDLFYPGLIDGSNIPSSCPKCKETIQNEDARRPRILVKALRGPYVRYELRENELVFDLKQKYLECLSCGSEIKILEDDEALSGFSRVRHRGALYLEGRFFRG
jgi:hypothetical protein